MSSGTRDLVLQGWQLANARGWPAFARLPLPDPLHEVTACSPGPHEPGPRVSAHVERY